MLAILLLAKVFVMVAPVQDYELQSGNFESGFGNSELESGNFEPEYGNFESEPGEYGFESGDSYSGFGGECGGSLIASRIPQNFSTPLYPRNYPNNLFCIWDIRTSFANERIYLVIDDFETEEPHDTEKPFDFMKVSTAITF